MSSIAVMEYILSVKGYNRYERCGVHLELVKDRGLTRMSGGPILFSLLQMLYTPAKFTMYRIIIVVLRVSYFCEHPVITNSHVLWVLCL